MIFLIDLHSHYLPGIDDGAKNVGESIKMLSDSFRQGVRLSVATPHCTIHRSEDIERFLKIREQSIEQLNFEKEKKNVRLPGQLYGAEIYLDNNINIYSDIEKLCIGETNLLLVEFPLEKYNHACADWLHSLNLMGIRPVVAHIDRYMFWQEMLNDFQGLDIVYQINAARFLSFSGRRFIKKLLKYHLFYIVSSDMHNMQNRSCNMSDAYKKAEKWLGKKTALKLFQTNAKKLFTVEQKEQGELL
ncbi:MAG: hypothetical protein EGR97_03565 [Clostridiales bacterium]|nr:hypothetical protein [Clostridiales bacterium]